MGFFCNLAARRLPFARTGLIVIFVSLPGFCGINQLQASVVVSANLTQTAAGSPNQYNITLNNSSTAGEAVSTFWFAWEQSGHNFMSVAPTSVTAPAGWTFAITNSGINDGYGIEFSTGTASLAAPPSPGGPVTTLKGFTFQSTASITQLQGKSVFYPATPVLSSVAFTGTRRGTLETAFVAAFQAKLIIFGDSLTDVGNAYNAGHRQQGSAISPPNYTLGKCTDGPDTTPSTNIVGTWIEQLAGLLNDPIPTPSSLGGGDYAFAGAKTPAGGGTNPGLGDQVNQFLQDFPSPSPDSIYVFWGGANDLLKASSAATLSAAEAAAISNLKAEIGQLANAGARNFLWLNLPPVGSAPVGIESGYSAPLNSACAQFSSDWSAAIPQLEATYPSMVITGADVYSLINQVIASPSTYGLANVTTPSQGAAVNPDTYLFWDSLHPTTVGHGLVAQLIFNATPRYDGVPDLLKYLCDINPLASMSSADRAALPSFSLFTTGGTKYLRLGYRQYALATDITVNVQTSPDLRTWTTVPSPTITQTGTDSNTGDPLMQVQVPATGSREFIRLDVTSP